MSIVIKNGIKIANYDNYTIYQIYTDDAEEYYMCTPTMNKEKYQMVVDFPEEYYKSLLPNEIINEITSRCNSLYQNNNSYIYILTNVTTYELNEAKKDNDNHAYSVLLRRLQKYTYNTYHSLTSGENEISINPIIDVIIETDDDKKFIDWLDINLNGLFNGIMLNNTQTVTVEDNEDNGWTTLSGPSNSEDTMNNTNTKANKKVKTLIPLNNKHGFSSIFFTITVIIISVVMGIIFSLFVLNQ